MYFVKEWNSQKYVEENGSNNDKSTRPRRLKKGDKVLLILPTYHNKLVVQWKGPYEVVVVVNRMDYRVNVEDKVGTYTMMLVEIPNFQAGNISGLETLHVHT